MSKSIFARTKSTRKQAISRAAAVESLETRTLMSTWYVANGGSDAAAGSITAPMASIQAALNRAAAGDTVTVRGGTYNLSASLSITKDNITLQGYAGETVRIVAPYTNSAVETAIRVGENADYVTIRNLDASGGYYYTLKTDSNWYSNDTAAYPGQHGPQHLLVSNVKLHDSGRDVVKLTPGTNYSIIENSEIYNSGRRDGSNAEGIDAVQANYSILRDSYIHDTTTNGVYYKGGDVGTIIERNRVTRTAHSGILVGQMTDEEWFDNQVNPTHYESVDAIVRNNIIWDTEGAGIGSWSALRPQIYNNTMVNVAKSMFAGLLIQAQERYMPDLVYVSSKDVTMYNNIVIVGGSRPAFEIRADGLDGYLRSDYNQFYRTSGSAVFSDVDAGFSGGLAAWKARGYDAHSIESNPNLDAAYHLTSTSAAIDRGTTLSLVTADFDKQARPAGGAYDIGADEFNGTGTVVDPTPTPDPTPEPTFTPQWRNVAFTPQTAQYNLEFDATPRMDNQDVIVGASTGAAASFSDMGVIVRFNSSGMIDVRNGSAYAAAASVSYTKDKSYHFKLVVNMATHTYDVYVTPAGGTAVKIATGYAFRTEQAAATQYGNLGEYNGTGDADVVGISAATITSPTPTPTPTPGWSNTTIATQTGKFTAEFDAKPGQYKTIVMAGLSNGAADEVADLVAAVRFNAKGYIDVRTGSGWSSLVKTGYTANGTYHFRFDIDLTTKRYDVYVTKPSGNTFKLASGFQFNGTQTNAATLNNFVGMTANGGTLALSNFQLLTSAPVTTTPTPSLTTDLASGKTTTATSTEGAGLEAGMATDGNSTTRWASGQVATASITVDLGATYNIGSVKLNWEYASAKSYTVQVSTDGVNWTTVNTQTAGAAGTVTIGGLTATGRFVRINCTQANTEWGYSLWGMEVYGR